MPTSFNQWSPILLFGYERMWILLLVPLSVLAAITAVSAIEDEGNKELLLLLLLFLTAAIIAEIFLSHQRGFMFLMFAITSAIVIILKKKYGIDKRILTGVLLCPSFLIALYFVIKNSNFSF